MVPAADIANKTAQFRCNLNCAMYLPVCGCGGKRRPARLRVWHCVRYGSGRMTARRISSDTIANGMAAHSAGVVPGPVHEEKIGVRGFEPPTPSSRTKCATRLRYTPILPFECTIVIIAGPYIDPHVMKIEDGDRSVQVSGIPDAGSGPVAVTGASH